MCVCIGDVHNMCYSAVTGSMFNFCIINYVCCFIDAYCNPLLDFYSDDIADLSKSIFVF